MITIERKIEIMNETMNTFLNSGWNHSEETAEIINSARIFCVSSDAEFINIVTSDDIDIEYPVSNLNGLDENSYRISCYHEIMWLLKEEIKLVHCN